MEGLPSVAVVVPMMDRVGDLRRSIPRLLAQDYPAFCVYVVDGESHDSVERALEAYGDRRLSVITRPRERYFNFARWRNTGIRYTREDLLLFLDADLELEHPRVLRRNVERLLTGDGADRRAFRRWRGQEQLGLLGYPRHLSVDLRFPRVYCTCLGSPLLVERAAVQAIGGYNETLVGWGYEDTDLLARLEFSGFGALPLEGIVYTPHPDNRRVRNFAQKNKARSWARNQAAAEVFLRLSGPVQASRRFPGRSRCIELDGVRYAGAEAPQQDWDLGSPPQAVLYRLSLPVLDYTVLPAQRAWCLFRRGLGKGRRLLCSARTRQNWAGKSRRTGGVVSR